MNQKKNKIAMDISRLLIGRDNGDTARLGAFRIITHKPSIASSVIDYMCQAAKDGGVSTTISDSINLIISDTLEGMTK